MRRSLRAAEFLNKIDQQARLQQSDNLPEVHPPGLRASVSQPLLAWPLHQLQRRNNTHLLKRGAASFFRVAFGEV